MSDNGPGEVLSQRTLSVDGNGGGVVGGGGGMVL